VGDTGDDYDEFKNHFGSVSFTMSALLRGSEQLEVTGDFYRLGDWFNWLLSKYEGI
jgi:hypothetical protein